jgi:hypothetical protein
MTAMKTAQNLLSQITILNCSPSGHGYATYHPVDIRAHSP